MEPGKSCSIPEKLHKTPEVDNIVSFESKIQNVYASTERRMKEMSFSGILSEMTGVRQVFPSEQKRCLRSWGVLYYLSNGKFFSLRISNKDLR